LGGHDKQVFFMVFDVYVSAPHSKQVVLLSWGVKYPSWQDAQFEDAVIGLYFPMGQGEQVSSALL